MLLRFVIDWGILAMRDSKSSGEVLDRQEKAQVEEPSQAQSPKENKGQGIADNWQGTLHAVKDYRDVVNISKGYSLPIQDEPEGGL